MGAVPGARDGAKADAATHGVVERPGLGRRGLGVGAVVVVVAAVFFAARTADRSPGRDGAPTTSTTTARRPSTTAPFPTPSPTGPRGAAPPGERAVVPTELPCPALASHPTGPPAYAFSAPTPQPEALIPGSSSHLSWIDPDLDVRVVPDSDVVILTRAGAEEHRTVGRIDPATGAWSESFTQVGCAVRDAAIDARAPGRLWLLLDVDGDDAGTYVADVSLDDGTTAWSARADRATSILASADGVWLVLDPLADPRAVEGSWSGRTALVAIDRSSHAVREPVGFEGALVTGSGGLGVARDGLVTRLDPTTGAATSEVARIADRQVGQPGQAGGRQVAGDLLLEDWGVVAVEAHGTRLEARAFDDQADEDPEAVWSSPCGGGVLDPPGPRRLREAVGAIVFVTSCDTEVRVHALDPTDGEHAPDLRFQVAARAYDWPVLQPPELTWDATGFWYVEQLATPASVAEGRTVADRPHHLFHVDVDRRPSG